MTLIDILRPQHQRFVAATAQAPRQPRAHAPRPRGAQAVLRRRRPAHRGRHVRPAGPRRAASSAEHPDLQAPTTAAITSVRPSLLLLPGRHPGAGAGPSSPCRRLAGAGNTAGVSMRDTRRSPPIADVCLSGGTRFRTLPATSEDGRSQIRFFASRNRAGALTNLGQGNRTRHGGAHSESRRPAAAGHRAPAHARGHRPVHTGRGRRAETPRRRAPLHRRRPRPRGPRPPARRRPRFRRAADRERRSDCPPRRATPRRPPAQRRGPRHPRRARASRARHPPRRCAAPPTRSPTSSGGGRDRAHRHPPDAASPAWSRTSATTRPRRTIPGPRPRHAWRGSPASASPPRTPS